MNHNVLNEDIYFAEFHNACALADETEQETRLTLLHQLRQASLEWDEHMRSYDFAEFRKELAERGLRFTAVDDRTLKAKWTRLFAAPVSKEERKKVRFDQFKWHLFSFGLLDTLENDAARKAFDAVPKDRLYFFHQETKEAYLIENAHLLKAEDFDHDFIPFPDFYLFSPEGKWTYAHTHEFVCGPYFHLAK